MKFLINYLFLQPILFAIISASIISRRVFFFAWNDEVGFSSDWPEGYFWCEPENKIYLIIAAVLVIVYPLRRGKSGEIKILIFYFNLQTGSTVSVVNATANLSNETVNAGNVTKLTGVPQIDYIYDPNLPRELNGYNLTDYPFYNSVPEDIDFKCDGLHDGFYASVIHKCQVRNCGGKNKMWPPSEKWQLKIE